MSERKQIEKAGDGAGLGDPAAAAIQMSTIESPPLAPQIESAKAEPAQAASAPEATATRKWPPRMPSLPTIPSLTLSRRAKRRSLMAATVILAIGLGAGAGALSGNVFRAPPAAKPDTAGIAERQAMQKTIARLNGEITALKANVETANRNASSQIAKITDRFERAERAAPATTGSIAPQRPAAAEIKAPATPPIVQGWFVRDARAGQVLVEGRGELYQVVLGAPLPGLGRVEAIKRQDGRWIVVTSKGIITSMRMRPPY